MLLFGPKKRRFAWLAAAIGLLSVVVSPWLQGGFFDGWRVDLVRHFQLQAFFLLIWVALATGRWRMKATLGLAALGLLASGAQLVPYWFGRESVKAAGALRVTTLNVLYRNDRYADTIAHLRKLNSDVIYLCETGNQWQERLLGGLDGYPFRFVATSDNLDGALILSRLPIEAFWVDEKRYEGADADRIMTKGFPASLFSKPVLAIEVRRSGKRVLIAGTHPYPASNGRIFEETSATLRRLGKLADGFDGEVVVIGDFNATPWSAMYRDAFSGTRLRNAARGEGLQSTWFRYPHAPLPGLGLLIDHVMFSEGLEKVSYEVGEFVGSDHRSVTVEFALAD